MTMGLLRGMARTAVVAGTATAVSNRVSRRQAERWQQQEYEQQQQQPTPASAQSGDDLTAELERLSRLRDQGVLTDEEFSAAKAKLLGL
jgi:membrane protease subunit (stomatin/prohibitin family)